MDRPPRPVRAAAHAGARRWTVCIPVRADHRLPCSRRVHAGPWQKGGSMERLLQDIIDILPVGVWVTDANGRFVRANPAARAIWRGTGPLQHADGDRFDAWWRRTCERFETMDWGTTQALANGRTRVAGSATIACFDGSTK